MRTSKVILKDNKIQVYTDWPSRLYFETPEMTATEIGLLYDVLRIHYGDVWGTMANVKETAMSSEVSDGLD